jgi:hypothetical protein
MNLPKGSTGFGSRPLPLTDVRAFKAACYAAARQTGRQVKRVEFAQVTPSFHTVTLTGKGDPVAILGHVVAPLVALAAPRRDGDMTVSFVDVPEVASALGQAASFRVLSAGELNSRIEEASLAELDPVELREIAYWKPCTLGEVIFNFWD